MKQVFATLICALCIVQSSFAAETGGEKFGGVVINNDWTFAMGNAASKELDYTHGTEYFTYICKAQSSNHSHAPIMPEFDDSSWQKVSLPHDWVVDLPYSPEASHSHGYKCIGWKYPENSVGWYRKHIEIPAEDNGKQFFIEFEGIYRDSEVFCNGFYLGGERSGYASSVYTLTPYLNYGGDNVIAVRCDASLEEGWYYEGAGIYRNVRLYKSGPVSMKHYSLKISQKKADGSIWTVSDGTADVYVDESCIDFDYILADAAVNRDKVTREIEIRDAEGRRVVRAERRWSIDSPYLYTLTVRLFYDGELSDVVTRRFGVRTLEFSPEKGLLLNGVAVKLRGANMHLDHAGVGVAVPDELWRYRISRLQEYGFNAVRTSHNCASVSMLDLCDEMGVLVIDENRQFGVNQEQLRQLRNMIDRDRNHPSVILWSVGNEEWAVEHGEKGVEIARRMSEAVHGMDRTRPSTYGNAGGPDLVKGVDVFGYNYIVQNPVDEYHRLYPEKCVVGTEETSGAGTRGVYRTVPEKGWMVPLNRIDTLGRVNVIEYGWKFYKARPWGLGLFYWTGFDYRGEPNPMKWPATGSQFGIFDYCGFPKDEAFYLKAAWKDEPSVHICGPYGGEVWVYSNCDEVRLYESGKSLGRRKMPQDGHLVWKVSSAGRAAVSSGSGASAEHSVAGGAARSSGPGASAATGLTSDSAQDSSTGSVAVSSAAGTLASASSAGRAAVSSGSGASVSSVSWSSADNSVAGGAAGASGHGASAATGLTSDSAQDSSTGSVAVSSAAGTLAFASSAGGVAVSPGPGSSVEHSSAGGTARPSGPVSSAAGSSTGSVAVSSAARTLASDSSSGRAAVSSGSDSSTATGLTSDSAQDSSTGSVAVSSAAGTLASASSAGRAATSSGPEASAEHSVAGGAARPSVPGTSAEHSSTDSVAVSFAARTLASDSSAGGPARPVCGSASSVSGTSAVTYRAVGYRSGRKVCENVFPAVYDKTRLVPSKTTLKADGQDVVVIDIYSPETELEVKVDNAVFLGWGNGDPGFKDVERPVGNSMTIRPFNGCAQVIVRSLASSSSDASSSSVAASSSIAASCSDAASCSVTDSRGTVTSRGTATVTVTPASASSSASASTVSLSLTKAF